MSLRNKLAFRSTLIFFLTLMFVVTGTYFLFRYNTEEMYRKKLYGIAELSGHFYLEKDELNEFTHQRIEKEFKRISKESVRLYKVDNRTLYVDDSLAYDPSENIINSTVENGLLTFKKGNRQFLSLLYEDNEGDFIIFVSGENTSGEKQLVALRNMLILFGFLGLTLHYSLTQFLANKTFKPFKKLNQQVNSIKGDDLQARIFYPGKKNDEVSNLIHEFNYFLDRIESSLTVQRNFLRNASHEIKTPLAIIIGDIEVALHKTRTIEEYRSLLFGVRKNSLHLKSIIESLIILSNLEAETNKIMTEVRIDEVIWDILDKKKIEYPHRKTIVDFQSGDYFQEQLFIMKGNRDLLFIAINNIIDNAFKFSHEAPIKIIIDVQEENLLIRIQDTGVGIPEEEQKHIFELFYRSSKTNTITGHGIGLYLTKQIMDQHHILIQFDSQIDKGTTFELLFPSLKI